MPEKGRKMDVTIFWLSRVAERKPREKTVIFVRHHPMAFTRCGFQAFPIQNGNRTALRLYQLVGFE